MSLSQIGNVDF